MTLKEQLRDFERDKSEAYLIVFGLLRDCLPLLMDLARERLKSGYELYGDRWKEYDVNSEIGEELADAILYAMFGIWQDREEKGAGIIRFPKEARQ